MCLNITNETPYKKVGKDFSTFETPSLYIYIRDAHGDFHHVMIADNDRRTVKVRLVSDNPRKEIEVF